MARGICHAAAWLFPLSALLLYLRGPLDVLIAGGPGTLAGTLVWASTAALFVGLRLHAVRRVGREDTFAPATWRALAVLACFAALPYALVGSMLALSPIVDPGPWFLLGFLALIPGAMVVLVGLLPVRMRLALVPGKALAACVSIVAGLVLVELGLRSFGKPITRGKPSVSAPDRSHWWYEPGSSFIENGTEYRMNSWGVRGPEPEEAEGFRVLLVGDSIPFGTGLGEEEVFPWLAASMWNVAREDARSLSMVNASLSSLSTQQICDLYEGRFEDLDHDVLVFCFYLDDVNRENRYKKNDLLYNPAWPEWVQDVVLNVHVCNRVFRFFKLTHARLIAYRHRSYEEAWPDALRALARVDDIARQRGARLIVFDIPRFDWEGTLASEGDYRYVEMTRELAAWCESRAIPYHSALSALVGVDMEAARISRSNIHFTRLGHRIVAEELAGFLLTVLD